MLSNWDWAGGTTGSKKYDLNFQASAANRLPKCRTAPEIR
jgi:hypothetical protein